MGTFVSTFSPQTTPSAANVHLVAFCVEYHPSLSHSYWQKSTVPHVPPKLEKLNVDTCCPKNSKRISIAASWCIDKVQLLPVVLTHSVSFAVYLVLPMVTSIHCANF